MKNQEQREPQNEFSEVLLFGAIILLIGILIFTMFSCNTATQPPEEEKILIHMSNGDNLELVADEYGNQYLKQNAGSVYIYIPYIGVVEETDTLRFYNAKN
jgi:hypothetical protein